MDTVERSALSHGAIHEKEAFEQENIGHEDNAGPGQSGVVNFI